MALRPNFDNPALWEVHDDINVFAEHHRSIKDKHGKARQVKFTRDKLERITRKSNDRDARGQPCPLMLGHTDDDAPETKQPPIAGYARKFKVAYDKRLGKWVIRCSYYLKKDRAAEAKEYPRTSVEVWSDGEFLDPIALLKRTPQLDLGQWTYGHRGDVKLRYSMDDLERDDDGPGRRPPPMPPRDDEGSGDETPPEHGDGGGGGEGGEGDAFDGGGAGGGGPPPGVHPRFHEQFKKCCDHHKIKCGMGEDHAGDVAAVAGRPGEDDEEPGGAPGRMRRGGKRRVSQALRRTDDPVLDRLDQLDAAIKNVRDENKSLRTTNAEVRRQRLEDQLERLDERGVKFDYDYELKLMDSMSDEQRDQHLRYMAQSHDRAPVGERPVRVADDKPVLGRYDAHDGKGERIRVTGGHENRRGNEPDADFTEEHLERAQQYIHEHPDCAEKDAHDYAYGRRTLAGELLRGNRNGR